MAGGGVDKETTMSEKSERWAEPDPAQWAEMQERLGELPGMRIKELERRIEAALLHYRIGEQAGGMFAENARQLVVSWSYVAQKMHDALEGKEEDGDGTARP